MGGIISFWWATSFRYGGRHHLVLMGDFTWNQHAGHVHDLRAAGQLLEGVACGALLGDKGYDADALIERLRDARIAVVIPPKSNRKDKRECDFILYRERNLIERLFGKLKQLGAIATRYDKLARNFLGAIRLVAAVIQLN